MSGRFHVAYDGHKTWALLDIEHRPTEVSLPQPAIVARGTSASALVAIAAVLTEHADTFDKHLHQAVPF